MNAETPTTGLTRSEILVNEIAFYTRDDISLFGFLEYNGSYMETEYLISRDDLQVLLSLNGRDGIETLWRIENLFLHPHQVPACINMVEIFGTTQALRAGTILLDVCTCRTEGAEGNTPGLLLVESVLSVGENNPFTNTAKS